MLWVLSMLDISVQLTAIAKTKWSVEIKLLCGKLNGFLLFVFSQQQFS